MNNQRWTGCFYCGATGDEPLADFLAKVAKCHNCRIDIALRGEWTGQGWARWQRVRAQYPEAEALLMKTFREVMPATPQTARRG